MGILVKLVLVGCLAGATALAGCGGGGDRGWLPDDIDRDATLDRLGGAAFDRLCTAFDGYVRDTYRSDYLVRAACTAHAISTTSTAGECASALEACLDTPPAVVEMLIAEVLSQASCAAVEIDETGCESTVSEIEGCLDALGAAVDQLQFTLTCAAAGQMVGAEDFEIGIPAECTAVISACSPPPP